MRIVRAFVIIKWTQFIEIVLFRGCFACLCVCVCACMSENCHNHEMTDRENTAAKTTHRQPSHLFERICTWYHIAFTYSVVCYVRKSISLMCMCAVEHAVWLNENITLFLAVSFSYFNVSGFVRSFPFLDVQPSHKLSTTRFIRFHLFSSSALSLADSRIVVKVHRHANLKHMDTTWNGNRFVTPIEYTIFAPETQTHTLFVLFVAKQPPHTPNAYTIYTQYAWLCVYV